MNPHDSVADDEISLLDIYEFLSEGWKTIAATAALGGAMGVGTALVLPEKYVASAQIETARVLGDEVETTAVLAEKLRSPTYYSQQTWGACKVLDADNPADQLVKALKPNVARNSAFVSVSFKAIDKQTPVACLNAVLADIKLNQGAAIERRISMANATLSNEREKLKLAEEFVEAFSKKATAFDFKDAQFSAQQLLLATLETKRNDIVNLRNSIQKTELLLIEPQTRTASFATPIYSPPSSVEPRLALFAALAVLAGAFAGLMVLVLRRVVKHLRAEALLRAGGQRAEP